LKQHFHYEKSLTFLCSIKSSIRLKGKRFTTLIKRNKMNKQIPTWFFLAQHHVYEVAYMAYAQRPPPHYKH